MHQQLLDGVAHRGALCLGIHHNFVCHVEISGGIDEHMAVSRSRLDHRHRGVFRHVLDEPRAATGNHDIDQAASRNQLLHRLARYGIQQFDCTFGDASDLRHDLHQHLIRARRFLPPAQDDGVPRLQSHHSGIHGDIGPRLVHDADHSQRNTNLADMQAVGLGPFGKNLADGIGQGRHLAHTGRHLLNSRRCQQKPVPHSALHAGVLNICGVGVENGSLRRFQGVGNGEQKRILVRGREQGDLRRRTTRTQDFFLGQSGDGSTRHQLNLCPGK